jgi:hypothetical protein
MKAEEFMIGDWVLYNETPQQILEISGIDDEVYLETDELVHQSEIQPIPLTPEILENNGFVEVKHYYPYPTYEYVVDSQKFLIRVAFPKDSKATERTKPFVEVDAEWCWHSGDCEFFHELQHVLRYCKIKKEIVL